jgi:hypothetical protein
MSEARCGGFNLAEKSFRSSIAAPCWSLQVDTVKRPSECSHGHRALTAAALAGLT